MSHLNYALIKAKVFRRCVPWLMKGIDVLYSRCPRVGAKLLSLRPLLVMLLATSGAYCSLYTALNSSTKPSGNLLALESSTLESLGQTTEEQMQALRSKSQVSTLSEIEKN